MKTIRNRIVGLLSAALTAILFAGPVLALTNPASYSPRVLQTQSTVHFRKVVNFNDANITTGVKFGAIPQNAYITSVRCYVTTAFNAGTTNPIAIGTTAAGSDVLAGGVTAGTNCVTGSTGNNNMTLAPGLGLSVTSGAATGSQGGFDLFIRYNPTGTAATAGKATFIIDYIQDDDQ